MEMHLFKNIELNNIPERMNNPFSYEPHPLCIEACRELQDELSQRNDWREEIDLYLIHISEPTRQAEISYAVFCLKKTN